ncbi:hypothetical protein A2U01_0069462 [Trifolium medium]|uniref:Uncharacterized protein n=1 Tax=Trifolium medium TaxID=97028 RepID=A0A392SHV1_9FABA|nr:hypothetical protein [Trifolium medium]
MKRSNLASSSRPGWLSLAIMPASIANASAICAFVRPAIILNNQSIQQQLSKQTPSGYGCTTG